MAEAKKELFKELVQINVNDYVEQKNGLNYLSWANAVQEICLRHNEEFDYEIEKFGESKLPYVYDDGVGFMVFTKITLFGKTREMWLPVMDNANQAMLKEPYTYKVKKYEWNAETRKKEFLGNYDEKNVEKATMFDINKTIMRCLVKNLAMFGLGLYIYAGEDLPVELEEPCTAEQIEKMRELAINEKNVLIRYKVDKLEDLTYQQAEFVINTKQKALEKSKKGEWLIMAEYGTPEWYEEQIKENTKEKTILVHALCDVSRQQFVDYSLIEDIAKRIADKSSSIKWQEEQLKYILDKQVNGGLNNDSRI